MLKFLKGSLPIYIVASCGAFFALALYIYGLYSEHRSHNPLFMYVVPGYLFTRLIDRDDNNQERWAWRGLKATIFGVILTTLVFFPKSELVPATASTLVWSCTFIVVGCRWLYILIQMKSLQSPFKEARRLLMIHICFSCLLVPLAFVVASVLGLITMNHIEIYRHVIASLGGTSCIVGLGIAFLSHIGFFGETVQKEFTPS